MTHDDSYTTVVYVDFFEKLNIKPSIKLICSALSWRGRENAEIVH